MASVAVIKRQHARNEARGNKSRDVSDISPSSLCSSDHASRAYTSTVIWQAIFVLSLRLPSGYIEGSQFSTGPGHKALKANWLIALSSPFPVPSFWPSASEAQMAARMEPAPTFASTQSWLIFTDRDDSLVSSRAQMSDEYHFTSQAHFKRWSTWE